jgi:hypothetical protein
MSCPEQSFGQGLRPSGHRDAQLKKTKRKRNRVGVRELQRRYENGLDLFTGQALQGHDANSWLHLQFEKPEECVIDEDLDHVLGSVEALPFFF